MPPRAAVGVSVLLAISSVSAQVERNDLSRRLERAEPIAQLPTHVKAQDGKPTLFADYGDVRGESVVLYLVNRTDQQLVFLAEDNDAYVKLEGLADSGEWERAQSHIASTCGNSATVPSLQPGEFFRFLGYYPTDGDVRQVRYRIYSEYAIAAPVGDVVHAYVVSPGRERIALDLASNAGTGRVRQADMDAARYDILAPRFGSFEVVRDMALGRARPPRSALWERSEAVKGLRRFPSEKTVSVLKELLDDPDERVRWAASSALGAIGVECPAAEVVFHKLLTGPDAARRRVAVNVLSVRPMSLDRLLTLQGFLEDADWEVRRDAVMALARACREFPEARGILLAHDDPNPSVQRVLQRVLEPGALSLCPPSRAVDAPSTRE